MNLSRMSRIVVAVSIVMALAPFGSVASAQSTQPGATCAIAQGPLTGQQESTVNDYEVQVARAQAKHTPVPPMPAEVFVLIGCISPETQISGQTTTTSPAPTSVVSQPTTSASSASSTFTCPPSGLSKDQLSQINDFEILVARANSKHTQVPQPSPEVAAFIACQ